MFGEFSFLSSTSGRRLPLQGSPWQQKGCGAAVPCPFVTVLATLAGTHHENPAPPKRSCMVPGTCFPPRASLRGVGVLQPCFSSPLTARKPFAEGLRLRAAGSEWGVKLPGLGALLFGPRGAG